MARKIINIDTYIGRWGYGKELLRFDLEGTRNEGALIRISSLGGDVFHALDMYNQVAAHGNVEVLFAGPSASAATFLAMAAQKISIVDNCFLLVHKVMAGVDSYGLFNEDELDALIRDLKVLKKENQQFDKAIAHIYSKRTGRSHEEMIRQMKANTWIPAQMALEMGFVDQVVEPEEKVNFYSPRFVAMVSSSELPPFPGAGLQPVYNPEQISFSIQYENHMKQYPQINRLLGVESLESADDGVYLNQDQLEEIDRGIEALAQADHNYEVAIAERDSARETSQELSGKVDELNVQLQTVISERDAARALLHSNAEVHREMRIELQELTDAIDSIDPTVATATSATAKAEAIRVLLSCMPGAKVPGILDKADRKTPLDGVDWGLIAQLPHNLEADKNM